MSNKESINGFMRFFLIFLEELLRSLKNKYFKGKGSFGIHFNNSNTKYLLVNIFFLQSHNYWHNLFISTHRKVKMNNKEAKQFKDR